MRRYSNFNAFRYTPPSGGVINNTIMFIETKQLVFVAASDGNARLYEKTLLTEFQAKLLKSVGYNYRPEFHYYWYSAGKTLC